MYWLEYKIIDKSPFSERNKTNFLVFYLTFILSSFLNPEVYDLEINIGGYVRNVNTRTNYKNNEGRRSQ